MAADDVNQKTMVTYRPADPDEFILEHDWVTTLEWFETLDEPVRLVREEWQLVSSEEFTLTPECAEADCKEPAEHWGLCEGHAREDDPEWFEERA